MPNFDLENAINVIACGLDEVGRGPLAGPVVAACVYIPDDVHTHDFIELIQDSKKLSKSKLLKLHTDIQGTCVTGIGICSPQEIDELNILWASMEAMKRAFTDMHAKLPSDQQEIHALVDGNRIPPDMLCPATSVVKGDSKSKSIAAASIIAKVTRDRIMADLSDEYPAYGWEKNAAYPTKQHIEAINHHGITPYHRKSFGPVKKHIAQAM